MLRHLEQLEGHGFARPVDLDLCGGAVYYGRPWRREHKIPVKCEDLGYCIEKDIMVLQWPKYGPGTRVGLETDRGETVWNDR